MSKKWGYVGVIIICMALFTQIKVNKTYLIKETPHFLTRSPSHPESFIYRDISDKTVCVEEALNQRKVRRLIEQMSLDEKIGQMIFSGMTGTQLTEETTTLVKEYQVGGIILFEHNINSLEQTTTLLNDLKRENSQNRLPIFIGVDQEGGRVERLPDKIKKLPTNRAIGRQDNEELSYQVGELLGEQLQAFGFNLNFAPVLDIHSNPKNPVIGDRSFGSRPETVRKLGVQTMKGMQAKQVVPVIKHFPGHGDTSVDSHFELPEVNKEITELAALELLPFKKAIEEGADMVMTAHILLPQIDATVPASMSNKIINGLLREQLDFDGVVITDDMTMQAITDHYDLEKAAVQSVQAGTDMILIAHHNDEFVAVIEALKEAVEKGDIPEERIDESLTRIIRLKEKYQLEDVPVESIDAKKINQMIKKIYSDL